MHRPYGPIGGVWGRRSGRDESGTRSLGTLFSRPPFESSSGLLSLFYRTTKSPVFCRSQQFLGSGFYETFSCLVHSLRHDPRPVPSLTLSGLGLRCLGDKTSHPLTYIPSSIYGRHPSRYSSESVTTLFRHRVVTTASPSMSKGHVLRRVTSGFIVLPWSGVSPCRVCAVHTLDVHVRPRPSRHHVSAVRPFRDTHPETLLPVLQPVLRTLVQGVMYYL